MSGADIGGWVESSFEPVLDAFAANFDEHAEVGAAVCVYLDGEPVVDLWGGFADATTGRPWTPRHGRARVLVDQGRHVGVREPADRGGRARPRRARRPVLARVRRQRQGGDHGRAVDEPPGRAAPRRRRLHARRMPGVGSDGAGARRPDADLGTGDAARLPHAHVRLAGGRARAPRHRPDDRRVPARRHRRAARPRLLDRAARGDRAPRGAPRAARARPRCAAQAARRRVAARERVLQPG